MRYKLLGKHSGIRISEIALGAGRFGTVDGMGADLTESRRMLEHYVALGGNFIDVSESYQRGEAEKTLGHIIPPVRDEIVLATKYSHGSGDANSLGQTGNSRKAMMRAIDASLRRLHTDRIDLYWVHMPDGMTPMEEILRGLEDLSRPGKILYGGLSNFPAWRTAAGATLAAERGWTPIAAQQIEYNLLERAAERDMIPMAEAHGIATLAWSPLAGGMLTGKYRRGEKGRYTTTPGLSPHGDDGAQKTAILDTLDAIAVELDANAGQVALAWVAAQDILPIIGPRTFDQLTDNLAALNVRISDDQLARLNAVSAIAKGYPHDLLERIETRDRTSGGKFALVDLPICPVP